MNDPTRSVPAHAGKPETDHPGAPGIWTFVFIDMVVFALLFAVFIGERLRLPDIFSESQTALDPRVGLLGTLLLICSSWCVAATVEGVRECEPRKARLYLDGAILLGLAFGVNKLIEYHNKLELGITPVTNGYFTFYFLITALHFVHVIGGLCFLGHCRLRLRAEHADPAFRRKIESTGLFWHFVDLLWLFIFPMLYLTGASWSG